MKPNISLINAVFRIACGLTIMSGRECQVYEKTLVQNASVLHLYRRHEGRFRHTAFLSSNLYVSKYH